MPYTADDVGPRMVNGRAVELTEAQKQTIAEEWNAVEIKAAKAPRPTVDEWLGAIRKAIRGDFSELDAFERDASAIQATKE